MVCSLYGAATLGEYCLVTAVIDTQQLVAVLEMDTTSLAKHDNSKSFCKDRKLIFFGVPIVPILNSVTYETTSDDLREL